MAPTNFVYVIVMACLCRVPRIDRLATREAYRGCAGQRRYSSAHVTSALTKKSATVEAMPPYCMLSADEACSAAWWRGLGQHSSSCSKVLASVVQVRFDLMRRLLAQFRYVYITWASSYRCSRWLVQSCRATALFISTSYISKMVEAYA